MAKIYRVTADITYIDGALAGLTITDGYAVPYPTIEAASRCSRWLSKVLATRDFIRATGTGHRYMVTGNVHVAESEAA